MGINVRNLAYLKILAFFEVVMEERCCKAFCLSLEYYIHTVP